MKDEMQNGQEPSSKVQLMQLIMGSLVTQLITVAAQLGIADSLKDGPKSADELADLHDVHPKSLYRALRTLASVSIFEEDQNGRFALTPMAELLRTDTSDSLRYISILKGIPFQWQSQGALLHQVKTGEVAFDHCYQQNYFDYLRDNNSDRELFDKAMSDLTHFDLEAIITGFDYSGIGTLVDVGGGEGSLIAGVLKANPSMHGIVADLPDVLDKTRSLLAVEGLAERCEAIETDFFQSVPPGGDAYIMRKVIHDWDDEKSTVILKNCRAQMGGNARVLVVETVVPSGNEGALPKLNDTEMMIYLGGRERTEQEYRALLNGSGFELTRIVPTASPSSIVEGRPI